MFKPSLLTTITENTKVATVLPSDPVYVAAKRIQELRVNSVIIMARNNIQGILTSKDILMRVMAQNLPPELTLVEKVMTPNLEYAIVDTIILEALHIMHDGKFLHLPVVDNDGSVVACVGPGNSFAFKFEDLRACIHRFNFGTENLGELVSAVTQRMGGGSLDQINNPQLMYDDD